MCKWCRTLQCSYTAPLWARSPCPRISANPPAHTPSGASAGRRTRSPPRSSGSASCVRHKGFSLMFTAAYLILCYKSRKARAGLPGRSPAQGAPGCLWTADHRQTRLWALQEANPVWDVPNQAGAAASGTANSDLCCQQSGGTGTSGEELARGGLAEIASPEG